MSSRAPPLITSLLRFQKIHPLMNNLAHRHNGALAGGETVADYSKKKKKKEKDTGRVRDCFRRNEKETRKRERCGIERVKRKEEGLCVKERVRQEEVFDVFPSPEWAFGADGRSEACPSA